jgi:plastocyanin
VDIEAVAVFHSSEREMHKGWVTVAVAAMFVAAACGGDSTGPSGPPVQTNQISITDDAFGPPNIQVAVGTTVTWTWNSGGDLHNVTFTDTTSGDRGTGTFARTFNTAGTFSFHCTIHSGMTGSVLVQ